MTDAQILTIALAVIFPVSMLIYSNSRVTEAKETLRAEMATLRAEMATLRSDLMLILQRIENKIDHIAETVASHSERLDKLDGPK